MSVTCMDCGMVKESVGNCILMLFSSRSHLLLMNDSPPLTIVAIEPVTAAAIAVAAEKKRPSFTTPVLQLC